MRYELRKLDNGWAVWDRQTNSPAVVNGCWQVDLDMEDADDLTDLLNRAELSGGPSKTDTKASR